MYVYKPKPNGDIQLGHVGNSGPSLLQISGWRFCGYGDSVGIPVHGFFCGYGIVSVTHSTATANLSDINNYRAIAISPALSKLFECLLEKYIHSYDTPDDCQFGFKSGLSASTCTNVLKQTVDYFTDRGSHVFVCFADFSKAFDRVNY